MQAQTATWTWPFWRMRRWALKSCGLLSSELAATARCHVDLLDLRASSTVMQYRIITTGQRLWARDSQAALYESFILSQKTALDEARAGLLQDIQETLPSAAAAHCGGCDYQASGGFHGVQQDAAA